MTIEKTLDLLYNKRCSTSKCAVLVASLSIAKIRTTPTNNHNHKSEGTCMFKEATLYNLETLTFVYWCLSRTRTGRNKERTTVAKAIETVNLLEQNLGPARPLLKCVRVLSDAIVEGKGRKLKIPASVSLLKLPIAEAVTAAIAIGGLNV